MALKDWTPQLATPWSLLIFLAIANKDKGLKNPGTAPSLWSFTHNWVDRFKLGKRIMASSEALGHCKFLVEKKLAFFRTPNVEATTPNPFSLTTLGMAWSMLLSDVPMVKSWINQDPDVLTDKETKSSVENFWKEALLLAALQATTEVDIGLWLTPSQLDDAIRGLGRNTTGEKGTPSEGIPDFFELIKDAKKKVSVKNLSTPEVIPETTPKDTTTENVHEVPSVKETTRNSGTGAIGSQMSMGLVTFPSNFFRPTPIEILDSDFEDLLGDLETKSKTGVPQSTALEEEVAQAELEDEVAQAISELEDEDEPPNMNVMVSLSKTDFEMLQGMSTRNSVTLDHFVTELLESTLKSIREKQAEIQEIEKELRKVEETRLALLEKRAQLLQ